MEIILFLFFCHFLFISALGGDQFPFSKCSSKRFWCPISLSHHLCVTMQTMGSQTRAQKANAKQLVEARQAEAIIRTRRGHETRQIAPRIESVEKAAPLRLTSAPPPNNRATSGSPLSQLRSMSGRGKRAREVSRNLKPLNPYQ
jgi:hypothetical protein